VLIVIETTDVIFALDSIPAILAITTDPFLVYTSNVFAILGLRALYFALAGIMRMFHYLHYGLSLILIFVGIKMILSKANMIPLLNLHEIHIPAGIALAVVGGVLAISVLASIIWPPKEKINEEENEKIVKSDQQLEAEQLH
jgi:tellurite resistance protein TerC